MPPAYSPGQVVWVDFTPAKGREQDGRRPAVVISTADYLRTVRDLVVVVPVTTTDRGWPHHVQLRGDELELKEISYAMTEQPRTVSRGRIQKVSGSVSSHTLSLIRRWVNDFVVMES
ncbi:type II toxin-antitoxin system PemK/MazF family toxin [Nocardia brevicatena]|uniref:type II toxin-antitoxin system PemK/MazF family toxin n=1 Tax=Nocardia brevicatena TaxID=37327 RepID=UPI000A06621E|nr:type II toxin-antitoxin system PemK/MazF family toxin [Nocardia brevicatena]